MGGKTLAGQTCRFPVTAELGVQGTGGSLWLVPRYRDLPQVFCDLHIPGIVFASDQILVFIHEAINYLSHCLFLQIYLQYCSKPLIYTSMGLAMDISPKCVGCFDVALLCYMGYITVWHACSNGPVMKIKVT